MSGIQIDVQARASAAERELANINQSLRNIEKTTAKTSDSLKNMFKGLALTATSALSLNALKNISTEFTNLSNKIATVTGRTKELTAAQEALFQISEDTRGSLAGTVNTFASFGRALKGTGASTDKILQATKAIQEAVAVSGSSAESANAAIIQLGQGLSAGVLRGEELNSVLEQAPRIAQAIADELKVTTGQLRLIAADGKLTSDVVFNAILRQAGKINKEFGVLTPTLTQGTDLLATSVKIYVNELDQGLGLSSAIGASLFEWSKRIKAASKNAFELGTQISFGINKISSGISAIAGPVGTIFKELGKQALKIIPEGFLTRTLKGDTNEVIRQFDMMTGGMITSFKRFNIYDTLRVESDVERAIRKLKRLSPKYWAASGFDVPTIERFFSRDNLMAYAKAFEDLAKAVTNNTDTFGGKITSFFRDIDFGFKSISRYFGFRADTLITFKGGQWEEFLTTLTEIIRGLSGASIKAYEFAKIIKTQVFPATYGFALAIKDSLIQVPGAIVEATQSALKAIISFVTAVYQLIKDLVTDFEIKDVFKEAYDTIMDFFDGVRDKSDLSDALDAIKSFGRKVIQVFFEIYDAVIGHSWWTDTVENIIDTSNTLWDKAAAGLNKFKRNTINIFKGIFDKSNRMSFNFDDIKSIDFSFTEFSLPRIKSDSFVESIVEALNNAKVFVINFFEAFPSIAKAALVGISGILIAMMFPAGAIKSALITAVLTSLATSGTLIAEQFGASLTGGSFVYEVGYKLGQIAGYFVGTMIRELPKFLNALMGVVSSFTRGFLEQMPLLGTAIKGIFGLLDSVGGSGPLGLLGSIFFGVGLAKLMASLNILKGPIESIFTVFKNISAIIFGDSKGKRDGLLSTYFFGALGPTRALSSIGLALSYLGAFDSLFAKSQIMGYAAQGGMLYLALAGDKGLDKVKDVMLTKVAKPIVDVLKGIGKNVTSGNKTLYDIFFGDTGTWTERASTAIKSVLDKITGKIVDMATPYVEKSYEFIKTMFLGTNSSATVAAIKDNLNQIMNFMGTQIGKIRTMMASMDLASMFSGLSKGPGLKDYEAAMKRTFGAASAQMSAMSGLAARIGGENGLLGRLFMGKYGKAALVAVILGVFSSVAFASEKASPTDSGGSVFDDITKNWNDLKLENPFAALAIQISAVAIPAMLAALFVFRTQAIAALSSIFNVSKITSWSSAFISGIGAVARNFKTLGLVAGAGGIGAAIGYKAGGSEMAIMGAMLAAELAIAFRKSLFRLLAGLGARIFTVAFAKVVAIVTALAAAGGALYLWFFGEKGQFWRDVGRAKDKVLEVFGMGPAKKTNDTGLSEESAKFAKSRDLPITYSLKDINMKALSKGENEKLGKLITDLEGTIAQSIQEEEFTGRVSKDTRDSIGALNRNLVRYSEKLAAKALPEVENFGKFLEDLQQRKPETRAGEMKLASEQFGLNIAYNINEALIKASRMLATTPSGKLRATEKLDKLQSEKGTRYNAAYRGRSAGEEQLKNLEEQSKSITFTSDILNAEIKKLKTQYVQSAKDLVAAESEIRFSFSQMEFQFQDLPESSPIKQRKLELERQLAKAMQEAVDYDTARKAIEQFQNSLGSLESNLNLIGVTFESNALFAGTEEAFDKLKKLGEEAKFLAEQLKNTKTVAEQNAIIVRINEIRTQTNIIKIQAEEQSLERTQFKLKDVASKLGSNLFSEETFKRLSDNTADSFFKEYNGLYAEMEALKVKKPINMAPVGAMEPGKRRDDLLKGLQRDQKDYLTAYFEIQDKIRAVEKRLQAEVQSGPAAIQAKRDVAAAVGIDFNKIVSQKGINSATSGIEKLQGKMDQLRQAERSNDTSAVQRLTKEIDYLTESLNEAPLNLQNFITAIQGLGQNLGLEELASLSNEAYVNLRQAANVVINLDKQMQKMGANISKADFEKILDKKLRASAVAFEAYLDTLYSTPDKIMQAFGRLGMSDSFELSFLSEDSIKQMLDMDKQIVTLQNKLKDPANVSRFREIVAQLDEAQQKAASLKSTFASFNTRLDIVNRAFGLGLEAEAFANLPKEIQITLSDQAQQMMNDLDRLLKTPMTADKSKSGGPTKPVDLAGAISEGALPEVTVTATRAELPQAIKDAFATLRKGAADAKTLILESGAVLQQALAKITTSGVTELVSSIVEVFPALGEFRDAIEKISREDLQGLAVMAANANQVKQRFEQGLATSADVKTAVQGGTSSITSRLAGTSYGIDTRIALKRIDVELSQASANLIDATEKALIDNLVREIEAARKDAESATSDKQRIAAQELINAKMEQLDEAIVAATRDAKAKSREAGKAFASSIAEGASTAFKDVLKGEKSVKEGLKSVLDSFTGTVIDTFIQGLMDPFTGENGIITRELRKLGSSLFSSASGETSLFGPGSKDLMSQAWGGIKNLFGFGTPETQTTPTGAAAPVAGALGAAVGAGGCNMCGGLEKTASTITGAIDSGTEAQRGFFGSIGDIFSKGLEGLGGLFSSAWQGLSGALGGMWSGVSSNVGSWFTAIASFFATGGYVSGPGTGTSDSIPAMLSDGEFVINSKSTKKYMPLLQALNSGKLPKFATGGLVGAAVMATPALATIDSTASEKAAATQQVFQINITGDISRQTRAEIQRMMPNIANGVNSYNREKR